MDAALKFERLYSAEQYYDALVALLPKGAYWDAQLADPESDLLRELMLQAQSFKAENDLIAQRLREGLPHRAEQAIRHWERLANLDGAGKSLSSRRNELLRWRSGRETDWNGFRSIVEGYGMRLLRIEQAYRPFTMHCNFRAPLCSRKNGNVRRFVIDPQQVRVAPDTTRKPFRLNDNLNQAIMGLNDWVHYAPDAPPALKRKLQEFMPLPYVAEIIYT